MRRPGWYRALTGILGVWLIATVSGVALQACPEHGGGWLAGSDGLASTHATHHGAPVQGTDASHNPHQAPDHQGHQCTCPGVCCVMGAVTAPAGRLVALPVVPVSLAAVPPHVERDAPRRAAPDVVLPLPLGPPTLRA